MPNHEGKTESLWESVAAPIAHLPQPHNTSFAVCGAERRTPTASVVKLCPDCLYLNHDYRPVSDYLK